LKKEGGITLCGRFTLTKRKEEIIKTYRKLFESEINDISQKIYAESYNIAPSQNVTVIYKKGTNTVFDYHRWGLIPHWAKDKKIGYKMINSRVETIAEKPAFKNSFFFNRCLIIADGYFEWLKKDKEKVPYYFFIEDHKLFAFAGIRSTWINGDEVINSCSIITTNAVGKAAKIHDRMPIILNPKAESYWINPRINEKEHLLKLRDCKYSDYLDFRRVSDVVNNPKINNIEIIRKIL